MTHDPPASNPMQASGQEGLRSENECRTPECCCVVAFGHPRELPCKPNKGPRRWELFSHASKKRSLLGHKALFAGFFPRKLITDLYVEVEYRQVFLEPFLDSVSVGRWVF